uniref:Uncharacterized protein n=1 Tax=Clastoptera arizonana TaxID=38151 RepID=A0A1B6BY38_9HEMI
MAVVNVSCKNLLEEQKEAVSSEPKKKKQKVCSKEINEEHFDRAQTKRLYLSLTKKGLADFSVMNMDQYNRWLNPEENNLKSSKTFCVLKNENKLLLQNWQKDVTFSISQLTTAVGQANRKEKIILVDNPKIVLSQVLKELDIEHNYSIIKSKTLNEVKVCLLIESVPCWSFIGGGITNDEANDYVAQQALQFFLLLSVETKSVKTVENSNIENKRNLI